MVEERGSVLKSLSKKCKTTNKSLEVVALVAYDIEIHRCLSILALLLACSSLSSIANTTTKCVFANSHLEVGIWSIVRTKQQDSKS
jgi:hypothetical protein